MITKEMLNMKGIELTVNKIEHLIAEENLSKFASSLPFEEIR